MQHTPAVVERVLRTWAARVSCDERGPKPLQVSRLAKMSVTVGRASKGALVAWVARASEEGELCSMGSSREKRGGTGPGPFPDCF